MSEFTGRLHLVFARFGPVQRKEMFGGYGIYHAELMSALVADVAPHPRTHGHSPHANTPDRNSASGY